MKDFDEFVSRIDSETYETIIQKAENAMASTHRQNMSDMAFFIALELLNCYHNWNSES